MAQIREGAQRGLFRICSVCLEGREARCGRASGSVVSEGTGEENVSLSAQTGEAVERFLSGLAGGEPN